MRFRNVRVSFRTTFLLKKNAYQKILTTNLDLSPTEAEQVLDIKSSNMPDLNKRNMLNCPRYRILNNCLLCQKFNINTTKHMDDLRYCLGLNNFTLEHRINVLKDIGVSELNIFLVSKIISLLNKPLSTFKKLTNVPPGKHIYKDVFDKFGESVADISDLKSLTRKSSVKNYYDISLLYCKTRIFDLPYLDDKILLYNGMRYKSISMIMETLKILRHDLNYDKTMIKKCPIVITASANNIRSLLMSFEDKGICGIPIVEVLRKYPYILFEDADNIKQLLLLFKRYEIPDEYVTKYMKILTMGNDIFLERIESIKRHPDLKLWFKYPRILQLIVKKGAACDRVGYLHLSNRIKWARLHTVLTTKYFLDKYLQYGNNTVSSKKYLKFLLMNELGADKTYLLKILSRHRYCRMAGFADIKQMLTYLKTDFTVDEICQNIHIILYARPTVEKLLADLREQYSRSTEFSFTNSQYLALCLYMLERDNHFTGNGIWNNRHNVMQHSSYLLDNQNIRNESDNDTNIMKDIDDNLDINYSIDTNSDLKN